MRAKHCIVFWNLVISFPLPTWQACMTSLLDVKILPSVNMATAHNWTPAKISQAKYVYSFLV